MYSKAFVVATYDKIKKGTDKIRPTHGIIITVKRNLKHISQRRHFKFLGNNILEMFNAHAQTNTGCIKSTKMVAQVTSTGKTNI